MDIGNALRRAGRDDITIISIIANTVSEVYKRPVKINSVKLLGKKVIIKTGNSLINSELQLLENNIKVSSITKLDKLGIKIPKDSTFRFM